MAQRARRTREPRRTTKAKSPYSEPLSVPEITPAAVKKRLSYRISTIIGPGPGKVSFAEAAARTGIKERTIRAYVDGKACPNLARYERLMRVFGPEVGIELAFMLGWEPRGRRGPQPSTSHLAELRHGVAQALVAIERVLRDVKESQPAILRDGL
ncbi:MAG: helix-turn-helix transcriptional regulator [Rhizobiaceae bacterium]|nr:helix-turn-helix transcriptional regulator [Rhizobiaceae bacterium]